MDIPPLLEGGFPPLIKAFTAALRRCSSSISVFRRRRRKKKAAPAAAATARMPQTTPTAIPTVLDLLPPDSGAPDSPEVCSAGAAARHISYVTRGKGGGGYGKGHFAYW